MKCRLFVSFFLMLCAATLTAGGITQLSDGRIRVGSSEFTVIHWAKGWAATKQSEKSVQFPGEAARDLGNGWLQRRGTFTVKGGTFTMTEERRFNGSDRCEMRCLLTSPSPIHTEILALVVTMPIDAMVKMPPRVNGKKFAFGPVRDEKKTWMREALGKNGFEMETQEGKLRITGPGVVAAQDNRTYGQNEAEIRFFFSPSASSGMIRAELKLTFQLLPVQQSALDFRSVANMGLADPVADDRQGGWTDQGPTNDLSRMKPGRVTCGKIRFPILDPARNNGKSALVLGGEKSARPWLPRAAELPVNAVKGETLYILNGLAWPPADGAKAGFVTVTYADGTSRTTPLIAGQDTANFWNPQQLPRAAVAWQMNNRENQSIGLYASAVALEPKAVKKVRFTTAGGVWGILGAVIAPAGMLDGVSKGITVSEGADWVPLPEERRVAKGGITDFSHLLDAPAGKHGFCVRAGDHFEFEKQPGKTARFWGANFTGQIIYADQEVVDEMLDIYAKSGMNLIRLHHFDVELYSSIFVKKIPLEEHERRFDYFIAACKKRGIYVTLDLQTSLSADASIVGEPHRRLKSWEYRPLCYFDQRVRNHLMDFSRKMLTHKNHYTGVPLTEEPALIFIHLINESIMPDSADNDIIRRVAKPAFEQYCRENHLSQQSPESWRKFVRTSYEKSYAEMVRELRKMGVKIPLTDLNLLSTPRLSEMRRNLDFVDNHSYWGHPVFLKGNWGVPMSVSQASAIEALSGAFNILSVSRLLDRPMTVTEWDFVNPNQYNVEGPFLFGGYGALNDYSAFCRFQFASWIETWKMPVRQQGYFDFYHDPMVALSMRAGSCFFLRGDVTPAKEKIAFLQDSTKIDSNDFLRRYPDVMARLALVTKAGIAFSPDALPKGTRGVVTMAGDQRRCPVPAAVSGDTAETLAALARKRVIPAKCYDLKSNRFTSLTGELELVGSRKTFRVVTPCSEGLIADKGQKLAGRFAELAAPSTFTAVLAASVDGQPLAKSRRILLLHLTDSKGKNMRFQDRWLSVVSHFGDPGLLMRRGTAKLTLRLGSGAKIYGCQMDGSRGQEIPCKTAADGRTVLALDNFRDGKALCIYEIVR